MSKLNPQALEIAKELAQIKPTIVTILEFAAEQSKIKKEFRAELLKQAAILVEL